MPDKRTPIAAFDIETDPFKAGREILQPFCTDFFDGTEHLTIWGEKCVKIIFALMKNFEGIIYAHNGGKFDFHFLLPYLPKTARVFAIRNRIASIRIGKTEFRDSFLIIPTGLAKFGAKLDINYSKLEKEVREQHREEILTYLKRDTEALYKGVKNFRERFGNRLTLAGTTFDILKRDWKIKPPHHYDEGQDELFRNFYYGGRVQCFRPGVTKGNLTYIDINSAYPHAMLKSHAFGLNFVRTGTLPKKADLLCSFVHFTGISQGVLPFRSRRNGLTFPNDETPREYYVTGWEFESGVRRGKIDVQKLHNVYIPQETLSFAKFVNHYYAEKLNAKQRGDGETELFAKLLLNSSYGRFALNPRVFREHSFCPIGEIPEAEDGKPAWEYVCDFVDAGLSLFCRPQDTGKFYNVATAASITGAVRAFMSESLDAVETPLYCDTDSIICLGTGSLELGDKIGQWKIEAEGDEFYLAGKKLYAFRATSGKWKIASKGAKLSVDEIKTVAQGGSVKWVSESPNFSISGSSVKFVSRTIKQTINKQ